MTDPCSASSARRGASSRASRPSWTPWWPGSRPTRWRARPAPDEWAPVEIVCHLRDEEAEDFGARVRVVLDGRHAVRADRPRGMGGRRDATTRPIPVAALAAFRRHRAGASPILAAPAEALAASGESPSGLRLSGLDLLAAWVAHDGLHLRQLAGTLAREWADRWAPLRADYAGPIPYPLDAARTDA